jgi:hypothetical protein
MKIYLKEPNTNRIVEFQNEASIGVGFANWKKLPQNKIDSFELKEAQDLKSEEVKAKRDEENISPITEFEANLLDDLGQKTGNKTRFLFYTSRHPSNPAADPNSILTNCAVLNIAINYATKDLDGNKIIIELTPDLAKQIASHIAVRNQNNYLYCNLLLEKIKKANNLEEVKTININFGAE